MRASFPRVMPLFCRVEAPLQRTFPSLGHADLHTNRHLSCSITQGASAAGYTTEGNVPLNATLAILSALPLRLVTLFKRTIKAMVTGSALGCSCYSLARKGNGHKVWSRCGESSPGLPFRAVSPSSSLCRLSLGAALQLESDLLPSRSRSGAGKAEPLCQLGCLGSSKVSAGSQLFRSCRWKVPFGALYTLPGLIPCSRQDSPHPSAAVSKRMLKPGVASRRLSCPKQRDFCLGEPGERRSIPPLRWAPAGAEATAGVP